jgi:hypothetical protein
MLMSKMNNYLRIMVMAAFLMFLLSLIRKELQVSMVNCLLEASM